MPSQTQVIRAPPVFFESDSDDDEVIFTKEMLKQLLAKTKELQNNTRPASSLSDSGLSSTSTVTEKEERPVETSPSTSNTAVTASS